MNYRVIFCPEAEEQLVALYHYIANVASPIIAARYIESIVNFCESLALLPHRGKIRDDVRSGLRSIHYKKRVIIAFAIQENQVSIIGVFYGGQDYETILQENSEDEFFRDIES